MLTSMERLEYGLSEVEKGLNVAGYVPGLNILSGGLRSALGQIQLITGLALGCLALLGRELATDDTRRQKFDAIANHAFEHAKHGICNFARGIIESSSPLYLGGLAAWVFYDLHGYRVKYPGEEKGQGILGTQDFSISHLSNISSQLRSMID